jgi:hypothetical protein
LNRFELLKALQEAGVDDQEYGIQDVSTGGRLAEGGAVVGQDDAGRWFVGGWERGQVSAPEYFDSEDEACRRLYADLTRPRPAPVRLTEEEEASGREVNRQQQDEYRRWLAERGFGLHGKPPSGAS